MSQRTLLGRIKALTARILDMQGKFNLPKDDPERWNTYGGALKLQKARTQRAALQAQLDPIRLIATGISCRDCKHFAYSEGPACWRFGIAKPTILERSNDGDCGPDARLFVHA
jgi:hypothetical protein